MIARLRSWLETRAESTPSDYTNLRIAEAYQSVSGKAGVRGSAAYISALNLISDSVSIAEVSGEFSESLKPHLGAIGRSLVDFGESVFEIRLSADGKITLLPSTIAAVSGGADPADWSYLLTRQGPTESTSIRRDAGAVLAFVASSLPKTPWRGRGRLEASGTGALLANLESQLALEAKVSPARVIAVGAVVEQSRDVSELISEGGVVGIVQATGTREDPSGIKAGAIKNETSAASVSLHEKLSAQVASALGVPADLIGSSASEAGGRESLRRFAASTINALLEIIRIEWESKIGVLDISMDALRAGDISARARALGSRSAVFKNLVSGGIAPERALTIAGLNE